MYRFVIFNFCCTEENQFWLYDFDAVCYTFNVFSFFYSFFNDIAMDVTQLTTINMERKSSFVVYFLFADVQIFNEWLEVRKKIESCRIIRRKWKKQISTSSLSFFLPKDKNLTGDNLC